jgi:hypothetical protein
MWAGKDNGKGIGWKGAVSYCQSLTLGGYSDWRLPDINELVRIYETSQSRVAKLGRESITYHVAGPLTLTGVDYWSATGGDDPHEVFHFDFVNGGRFSFSKMTSRFTRALCVRTNR